LDWRLVANFVAGIIGLCMIVVYFKSGALPKLRWVAGFALWNVFYFTFFYGVGSWGHLSSSEITFFLRPFAGVLLMLAGLPFLSLAIIKFIGK